MPVTSAPSPLLPEGVPWTISESFQKQTQKTRKADLDLATRRYRDLVKALNR